MSVSLKHIPCPAGNTCTAFQCIFGHPGEKSHTATENQPSPQLKSRHQKSDSASSVTQAQSPRKRRKHDNHDEAQRATSSNPGVATLVSPIVTATRSVSPPPVYRQRGSPNVSRSTLDVRLPTSPAAQKKQTASPRSRSTQKSSEEKRMVKPESLNPRLLKSSPVSHELRLKLLKMLHEQLKRLNSELQKDANDEESVLVLAEQQLIFRALNEEQQIAQQKGAVYANVMKNLVMQYKRMGVAQWKKDREKEKRAQDPGQRAADDESAEAVKIETGLTPEEEVTFLEQILTRVDHLSDFGYVPVPPSEDAIAAARSGVDASQGWEKCDRCQQRFQVFPGRREEDGALTSGGKCTHHWGKTFLPPKPPTATEKLPRRYRCCGEDVGDSAGCFTGDHHVFKVTDPKRLAALTGFKETPENPTAPTDRAVCLDCEMGYTVYGLELIRLTATSWPIGEEILDVLVRPLGEILDLNSRFSGVWPDDFARAKPCTTANEGHERKHEDGGNLDTDPSSSGKRDYTIVSSPEEARDLLFSLISPTTPLIGHGLENDLNAVRIVHPTLVDTALLYPHRAGLPFRNGLKMLMAQHLNRRIQQEDGPGGSGAGHDSAEDARAAGELVRLRVMREWGSMRRAGWNIIAGRFVPPIDKAAVENGALTEALIEA